MQFKLNRTKPKVESITFTMTVKEARTLWHFIHNGIEQSVSRGHGTPETRTFRAALDDAEGEQG